MLHRLPDPLSGKKIPSFQSVVPGPPHVTLLRFCICAEASPGSTSRYRSRLRRLAHRTAPQGLRGLHFFLGCSRLTLPQLWSIGQWKQERLCAGDAVRSPLRSAKRWCEGTPTGEKTGVTLTRSEKQLCSAVSPPRYPAASYGLTPCGGSRPAETPREGVKLLSPRSIAPAPSRSGKEATA